MTTSNLAGKRILVVEDEYFIASDIKRALLKEEATVVGPVSDLSSALSLAADGPLDAAILDVNLGDGPSFPIAEGLAERTVPYMFLTGYDAWALPEQYRGIARVSKPCPMENILACVRQLVGEVDG